MHNEFQTAPILVPSKHTIPLAVVGYIFCFKRWLCCRSNCRWPKHAVWIAFWLSASKDVVADHASPLRSNWIAQTHVVSTERNLVPRSFSGILFFPIDQIDARSVQFAAGEIQCCYSSVLLRQIVTQAMGITSLEFAGYPSCAVSRRGNTRLRSWTSVAMKHCSVVYGLRDSFLGCDLSAFFVQLSCCGTWYIHYGCDREHRNKRVVFSLQMIETRSDRFIVFQNDKNFLRASKWKGRVFFTNDKNEIRLTLFFQ